MVETYTLYWLDGKRELVNGEHIADAMTAHGYGAGALRALDFYAAGDCDKYEWNPEKREWESLEIRAMFASDHGTPTRGR